MVPCGTGGVGPDENKRRTAWAGVVAGHCSDSGLASRLASGHVAADGPKARLVLVKAAHGSFRPLGRIGRHLGLWPGGGPEPGVLGNGSSLVASVYLQACGVGARKIGPRNLHIGKWFRTAPHEIATLHSPSPRRAGLRPNHKSVGADGVAGVLHTVSVRNASAHPFFARPIPDTIGRRDIDDSQILPIPPSPSGPDDGRLPRFSSLGTAYCRTAS